MASKSWPWEPAEKKIKFYQALLEDERQSSMGLDYWIDYMDKFDVGHRIPLYDRQGLV